MFSYNKIKFTFCNLQTFAQKFFGIFCSESYFFGF